MGVAPSSGLEGIALKAYPILSQSQLTFKDKDLNKLCYNRIYETLKQNEWLPQLEPQVQKSNSVSEQFRTSADQLLKKQTKGSDEILRLYTKAICTALPDSKEIAMAYASRSAVTFGQGEYREAIKDLDRALAGNYPELDHSLYERLYERRGRCFQQLGLYSKALEDFKSSKAHLEQTALNPRKQEICGTIKDAMISSCENKQDKPQETTPNPIKLSHPPSPYIQSASAAVDIKYSQECGRHVVAAMDIKPGDVISIEKPYVSVLKPDHVGHFFCDYCKKKSLSTVACASCVNVVFCSEDCRQSSWEAYHRIECKILPTLISLSCSNNIEGGVEMETLTALRILIVASNCGEDLDKLRSGYDCLSPESAGFVDGKYLSNDYTAVHHLATNMESRSREKLIELAVKSTCLVHLLKAGAEFFRNESIGDEGVANCPTQGLSPKNLAAADLLLKYLMIVHINGHIIGDIQWKEGGFPLSTSIASAVFPFHSLFNHSCNPNITHFAFKGDAFYSVAIQPIKRGQQIFEDYGYNFNAESLAERQTELKRHYNFTCKCDACLDDWPSYLFLDPRPNFIRRQAKGTIMDHVNRFPAIQARVFYGAATDEHLKFLSQFMILAQENLKLPWRPYVHCQDTIKCYMNLKGHPELLQKAAR